MSSKMLIDASHPEETRVVVVRGNRVEEFDFESANRKQLRGNIYLAKVTRVEPSLQAAFVDYGGNRHGFLAFSEIHPDYYQIPVADRQALIAAQERAERDADAEADQRAGRRNWRSRGRNARRHQDSLRSEPVEGQSAEAQQPAPDAQQPGSDDLAHDAVPFAAAEQSFGEPSPLQAEPDASQQVAEPTFPDVQAPESAPETTGQNFETTSAVDDTTEQELGSEVGDAQETDNGSELENAEAAPVSGENGNGNGDDHSDEETVESVGGADALEEVQERMPRVRARQYKIQEVIKRRQVMLVQVVKEERGTKGAALTTYLSLAGRYSVLMPNTSRGGGISRKITSAEDRNRLKEIAQDLEVPEGMGVILRTAGASRTKLEVKRDFEYLLRIWEQVRDLTLKSTAPKLVYEEGSLVKRSIRDLYSKDIDEIVVAGEDGYNEAKEFMRMLMPSHAKNVKLYHDNQPLFTRYGIESQLDAMFTPTVQLKSGGYIVINQTEALVAIDVNSGRATREHSIEDTAVKTNSEAAEEIARQLRLRDLAGLIVIDFIDMDEGRNNRTVERRLKDALKHDRARIQVGRISHFGLLEMSRQRIRSSVLESSTEKCPVCGGTGHVRSVSSVTLALLRAIEEALIKGATHNLIVRTRAEVALYVLNQKRSHLRDLEERFRVTITVSADPAVVGTQAFMIDRGEQVHSAEAARALAASQATTLAPVEQEASEDLPDDEPGEAEAGTDAAIPAEAESHEGGSRRRRRRRGGRGRSGEREAREPATATHDAAPIEDSPSHEHAEGDTPIGEASEEPQQASHGVPSEGDGQNQDGSRRRRRRGRRGGRRHRRNGENGGYQGQPNHAQEHSHEHDDHEPGETASYGDEQSVPVATQHADAAPAPAPVEPPAPAAAMPESSAANPPDTQPDAAVHPRRGSTVREPASSFIQSTPSQAPAPTPIVSSTPSQDGQDSEDAAPKRGWWGRRLMGKS
jgi:ribonuclease E